MSRRVLLKAAFKDVKDVQPMEGTVKQEPDTSQSGFTGEEKLNLKTATDEECYNQYLLLRSNAVLLAYFPRRWEQIKLTNAAFNYCSSVTGVPLKCLDCERPFPESKTVVEHAKLCKGIQEDDKEELIPVTPKKAPRRGGRSSYKPDLSITEFEKTPYLFVLLTPQLQNNLAKEILALEHVIACPGCGATYEEAGAGAAHLAFCLAPQSEYDRYKGRLSDLQSLPDREFRRIVRGTVTQSMKIVCHACGKVITTPYGAEYHVLRCGRNPEDRPWKCHYCGFASTQSLSKQHLDVECEERRKAMNSEGRTFVKEEAESEEEEEEEEPAPEPEPEPQPEEIYVGEARPKRVPKRRRADADGDHNDPDFHPTATAEIAIGGNKEINKFLTAIGSRKKMNAAGKLVKHREMPSISGGLIPGKSSRVSVGRGGTLRFKFRKLDVTETVPNQADLGRYQRAIWECQRAWEEEVMNSPFTNPLLEIPTVSWEEVPDSEYIASLRVKESIGIRHGKIPATPRKPPPEKKDRLKGPPACGRIKALPPTELPHDLSRVKFGDNLMIGMEGAQEQENHDENNPVTDWASASYVGGPVNSADFSATIRLDGSSVLALSVYPDDSTLTGSGNGWRSGDGYFQIWNVIRVPEKKPALRPCCMVQIKGHGMVMKLKWCAKPCNTPEKDIDAIGYLAVATASGKVLIYRLADGVCKSVEGKFPLYAPKPNIVLCQQDSPEWKEGSAPLGVPPIISLDWTFSQGGDLIAAVNAAGAIVFWELSKKEYVTDEGLLGAEMIADTWSSPAVDACWNSDRTLAVSFRERTIRLLDTKSGDCLLEETTVRTAGAKAATQLRLFPGVFIFQAEPFATNDSTFAGVCYLVPDQKNDGYFVVPLSNRHELQIFDVAACATNGLLVSCGVDGALLVSTNGRLAPAYAMMDFTFSAQRKALQLTRYRINLPSKEPGIAPPLHDTHETAQQYSWLDVNTIECDRVPMHHGTASCGDLRLESLNVVATSYGDDPVMVTGGQAGLLFMLPCAL